MVMNKEYVGKTRTWMSARAVHLISTDEGRPR